LVYPEQPWRHVAGLRRKRHLRHGLRRCKEAEEGPPLYRMGFTTDAKTNTITAIRVQRRAP
jgi:hypothetical protein